MKKRKKKVAEKRAKKTGLIKEKKAKVLTTLTGLGEKLYNQIAQRQFPWIQMPNRSIYNIKYDQNLRQYILGDKSVKRSSRNIKHIRPLTQLVWTASFVDELKQQDRTSTLRDVFYSAQAYEMNFADQTESDNIITDLETVIGHSREDFNVFPEERSAIFGNLVIEYTVPGYEGKRLNLASHPDGMMIGPALTSAEFVECKADKIIAIEKGGLFTRFVEEKVHDKYKAILIHTAGQAPRATRSLLRRLNQELDLPVFIFSVDGDETILIEKNGLLRNVRIGDYVDRLLTESNSRYMPDGGLLEVERAADGLALTGAISPELNRKWSAINYALRHPIHEPLWEIVAANGYAVKVTGSHSVMSYDGNKLVPRRANELRVGDFLVACTRVPAKEDLVEIDLLELISGESPDILRHLWIVGDARESIACRYAEDNLLWRRVRARAVPFRKFIEKNVKPSGAKVRWAKSEISYPSRIRVSAALCRLLGYYVAEGCVAGDPPCIQLSFGRHERHLVDDAVRCVRKVFKSDARVYFSRSEALIRFGGPLLAHVFAKLLGAGGNAAEKSVPFVVFNIPKKFKLEFLKGYYRGDGIVRLSPQKVELSAPTVSRKLASDLVLLLSQLGVWCSVERVRNAVRDGVRRKEVYRVTVRHQEGLSKLYPICADLRPDLAKRHLRRAVRKSPIWRSLPSQMIFSARDTIRKRWDKDDRRWLETFLQHGLYGYKRIPYHTVSKILAHVRDESGNDRLNFIRKLVQNDLVLLPIKQIRQTRSSREYVYDIEVDGMHTFTAGLGPLVLHNTDADPWGMHIAMVIISGSANAAHLRDLNTPDAKWAGVWASDIVEYDLPSDKLTDLDVKRLYELEKDPRYEGKLWKREIETFLKVKKKAEQEAFSRYGLAYIVDEYLPAKLEEMEKY